MKCVFKKILLISWLAICTIAFVYFTIMLIKYTGIAIEQLSDYKAPNAAEVYPGLDVANFIQTQERGIARNIFLILFLVVLYTSFAVLLIVKIISIFHKSNVENGVDIKTR